MRSALLFFMAREREDHRVWFRQRESARRGIFISFVRRTRKSTAKHHDGYFFTWQINRKALPLSFIRPSLLFHTFYLTTFVSLTPDICLVLMDRHGEGLSHVTRFLVS